MDSALALILKVQVIVNQPALDFLFLFHFCQIKPVTSDASQTVFGPGVGQLQCWPVMLLSSLQVEWPLHPEVDEFAEITKHIYVSEQFINHII